MQTPAPSPSLDALVRPWRTATLVVGLVAAVELVVIVVAGVALLGKPLARHVRSAAAQEVLGKPSRPKPTPTHPVLPRARTRVVVLNGNGVSGAAGAAAEEVTSTGHRVASVGNASRSDYGRSVVMYRPGRRAEAERLARDLGVAVVGPLDGVRPGTLRKAHLVFVVGV